jgi:hypothetical protein
MSAARANLRNLSVRRSPAKSGIVFPKRKRRRRTGSTQGLFNKEIIYESNNQLYKSYTPGMVQGNLAESRFGYQGHDHDFHFRRLDRAVPVFGGQHIECHSGMDFLKEFAERRAQGEDVNSYKLKDNNKTNFELLTFNLTSLCALRSAN